MTRDEAIKKVGAAIEQEHAKHPGSSPFPMTKHIILTLEALDLIEFDGPPRRLHYVQIECVHEKGTVGGADELIATIREEVIIKKLREAGYEVKRQT